MRFAFTILLAALTGCEHGPPDVPRTSSAQETLWVLLDEQLRLDALRPFLVALDGKSFSPSEVDELTAEVRRAADQVDAAAGRPDELRAARYRADVVGVAYDLSRAHAESSARGYGRALGPSCLEGMKLIREARRQLDRNPGWPVEASAEATRTLDRASLHAENAMRAGAAASFARSGVAAASLINGAVSLARLGVAGVAGLQRLVDFLKGAGAPGGALAAQFAGGAGSVRLLTGSGALVLTKAEVLGLAQAGAMSAAALHVYLVATHTHHIATNQNYVSTARGGPWSPFFEDIFKRAGMSLDDEANLVEVAGHQGPHPEEYHRLVYRRLSEATNRFAPGSPEYRSALVTELGRLAKEIGTPGTRLNLLVRGLAP